MFSIDFLLIDSNNSYKFFNKMFYSKFIIYNQLVKHCINLLQKLKFDSYYQSLLTEYKCSDDKSKKAIAEDLNDYRAFLGLSKSGLEFYVKSIQKKYKKYISSQQAQCIVSDIYNGVEKCIYNGAKLHYKKFNDFHSVSAKSLTNGITGLDLADNKVFFNKFCASFIFKDYDMNYINQCFENDVKFCRLIRKPFNSGFRYYIQMVFEGIPPLKYTKGIGDAGIDDGVSTVAAVTDSKCILKDLAPNVNHYNNQIIKLQKAMDRSLRFNNPDCYNDDGTIKKGAKLIKSKNYIKLLKRFKSLHRKRTAYIDCCHFKIIKDIIEDSNRIFYEKMNFKALQKRAKETKKNDYTSTIKTKKGESKEICKFKRKKRFGKSLNNKSPASFITKLKNKADFYCIPFIPINTKTYKASQYNHFSDTYIKKKLKDRWNYFNNGDIIQRDLYSAFLIKNPEFDFKNADRIKCIITYNAFKDNHDKCIKEIKLKEVNRPSCFGF